MQIATQLLFALIPLATSPTPMNPPPGGDAVQPNAVKHSYGSTNALLEIDGKAQQILTRFGGTSMRTDTSGTSDGGAKKSRNVARPEDVKIELPIVPDDSVQAWITEALGNNTSARGIRILENDHKSVTRFVHTLGATAIHAVELHGLDNASKEGMTWELSLGPTQIRWEVGDGKSSSSKVGSKSKAATSFRLAIDGVETSRIQKIDPIRVELVPSATGLQSSRDGVGPRVAPIHLTFGGDDPSDWVAWFEEGRTKSKGTRTAVLELLDPSMKEVLARVTFGGVALTGLSSPNSNSSAESIRTFEAELSWLSCAVVFQPK